jgi:hypothetical protein
MQRAALRQRLTRRLKASATSLKLRHRQRLLPLL